MKDRTHLVIDLETLDTAVTAKVLSVGYAIVHNCEVVQQSEYRLDLLGQEDRTLSISTLEWWLDGDKEQAQQHLSSLAKWSIETVHSRMTADVQIFSTWDKVLVWGNSPNFDCDILGSLFHGKPWKFYNERDLRTLRAVTKAQKVQPLIPHTALYDAVAEAEELANYLRTLP